MAEERRKDRRMKLSLPVRVQGHGADGSSWEEMTSCEDASYGGASFTLKHAAFHGQVLLLQLPLPKNFRSYALSDASYSTYGVVRAVQAARPSARVGVMFIGRTPPKGYQAHPGGRYLLSTDPKPASKERRRLKRVAAFVNLRLRRVDPAGRTIQEEQTVTENVSRAGARVMTSLPVSKGEFVVVEDLAGSFQADAEITNVFIGSDGVPRLNLHFASGTVPDQLLAAAGLGPSDL